LLLQLFLPLLLLLPLPVFLVVILREAEDLLLLLQLFLPLPLLLPLPVFLVVILREAEDLAFAPALASSPPNFFLPISSANSHVKSPNHLNHSKQTK
jgi:hypothetical protein